MNLDYSKFNQCECGEFIYGKKLCSRCKLIEEKKDLLDERDQLRKRLAMAEKKYEQLNQVTLKTPSSIARCYEVLKSWGFIRGDK